MREAMCVGCPSIFTVYRECGSCQVRVWKLLPQANVGSMQADSRPTRSVDDERMASIVAFTAQSMRIGRPRPFGASILHTKPGKMLPRALPNPLNGIRISADVSVLGGITGESFPGQRGWARVGGAMR
jgi:hypothetical protein